MSRDHEPDDQDHQSTDRNDDNLGQAVRVGPCDLVVGLFAARAIPRGGIIAPIRGRRYHRDDPIHRSERGANLLQTGYRTYVLPEAPAVYANHSCLPNAGVVDSRRLVALRDIAAGEEIRWDYSTSMDEDFWTMRCRCGAPGCRGIVGDFRRLPRELRRRYLELGIVPRFIAWRYSGRGCSTSLSNAACSVYHGQGVIRRGACPSQSTIPAAVGAPAGPGEVER